MVTACKELLYDLRLYRIGTPKKPKLPAVERINEPAYFQFFDQAIEWAEATYSFADTDANTQRALITRNIVSLIYGQPLTNYQNTDQLRVMVPVKPGFNFHMLYFLASGAVSLVAEALVPVFNEARPIAAALKEAAQQPHQPTPATESWEVVVPTNMQWLQNEPALPETIKFKQP